MAKHASLDKNDLVLITPIDNWERQLFSLYPDSEKYWFVNIPNGKSAKRFLTFL